MRTLSIIALLSIVLLAGCVDMSAEQIAEEMQKKYESIKDFRGTIVTTVTIEGRTESAEANFMYRMQDNKLRQEFTKGESSGSIMVSNGTVMWLYNSTANEVAVMDVSRNDNTNNPSQSDYGKLVRDMLKRNDIRMSGSEKIGNRDTFILEIEPRNITNMTIAFKQKLWVDKEMWMPLRIETYDKDGKLMMTMEYRNVEFNTGIPDSEFEFKIPEGARVVTREMILPKEMTLDEARKSVNFTVIVPEYLPEGYLLDKTTVFKFGETQSLSISYKKGDEMTISIFETNQSKTVPKGKFETVKIKGIEARYIDTGYGRSLSWAWKGTDISIHGDISREELIEVAESVR
ncbi:MAG: DUF4367 domain-containing protein [Candidatus Methanoperedens sp.]|nr:DUF4367 domain-containing protein [Candidatus Methanoperedens sp.]